MNKHVINTALSVLLASVFCAAQASESGNSSTSRLVQQPATQERAENAVSEMEKLFSSTSAAKQVGNSKSESVSDAMHEAEGLRHEAHEALEEKGFAEAIHLADEAKNAFFAATQHTEPDAGLASKYESDFKHMLDSVNALTEALERIAKEAGKNVGDTLNDIRKQVKEANSLAAEKKYVDGQKVLDHAFLTLKISIQSIKQGTTVTASKDESPKGIYEYEVFRNDTYRSLIEMLMDDRKKLAIASDPGFLDDVKQADAIRNEGMATGEKKHYEEASEKLSKSTSIYKSAVRRAGIPVF